MRYLRLAALGFVAALLVACNGGDLAPIGSSVAPHFARPNVTGASREKFAYAILDAFNTGQLTGQGTLAGLIRDSAGALYGTTYGGGTYNTGTVFKLSPSGSSYVGTTLYSFGPPPDGGQPAAQLLMDSKGALYGTTEYGGPSGSGSNTGSGIAFKLTPGSSEYTETVLHAFGPQPDGQNPRSGLIADTSGALYGTTRIGGKYDGGTVFKLTPSGSGYTESILLSFNSQNGWNPNYGNLLLGKNRTLYGTTSGNIYGSAPYGNVFELKPSGGKYRARVLYNLPGHPMATLRSGHWLPMRKDRFTARATTAEAVFSATTDAELCINSRARAVATPSAFSIGSRVGVARVLMTARTLPAA